MVDEEVALTMAVRELVEGPDVLVAEVSDAEDDVDEADEEADDDDLVGAAPPLPDLVRTAVDWEPTSPGATQFMVRAWRSMTPTCPGSQQKPLPSMPEKRFQVESAQLGAP